MNKKYMLVEVPGNFTPKRCDICTFWAIGCDRHKDKCPFIAANAREAIGVHCEADADIGLCVTGENGRIFLESQGVKLWATQEAK